MNNNLANANPKYNWFSCFKTVNRIYAEIYLDYGKGETPPEDAYKLTFLFDFIITSTNPDIQGWHYVSKNYNTYQATFKGLNVETSGFVQRYGKDKTGNLGGMSFGFHTYLILFARPKTKPNQLNKVNFLFWLGLIGENGNSTGLLDTQNRRKKGKFAWKTIPDCNRYQTPYISYMNFYNYKGQNLGTHYTKFEFYTVKSNA